MNIKSENNIIGISNPVIEAIAISGLVFKTNIPLQKQNKEKLNDDESSKSNNAIVDINDVNKNLFNPNKLSEAEKSNTNDKRNKSKTELSQEEKDLVNELKSIDQKVRAHEQAHLSAAAGLSASAPSYSYTKGPDGLNYVVGGEVSIDASPIDGDPKATIIKMQQVQAAALAPSDPSGQDQSVASAAGQQISQSQAELSKLITEENSVEISIEDNRGSALGNATYSNDDYPNSNQINEAYNNTAKNSGVYLDLIF